MFFISPENNYRLSNESNSVLLIGGFGGWWNFGDVLQLKSALDRYVGYERIILVHLSSVIEEKSLSKLKDVFSDAIPLFYGSESEAKTFEDLYGIDLQEPKINLKVLHVYGGGFLNEFWGRASIEVIENALNAFKPKYYVISGQQISPLVSNIFKRHVEIYNPDIIGVRDYDSLKVCKNVNVPAEFSWDDGSDLILSLKKQLTQLNPPNSVYLHINLSNYVLSKSSFNEFIADITSVSGDKKSKFVLLNAYNRKSIAVKDTLKSIEYLGLEDIIPSFKVLDLVSSVFLHDSKPLMEMLRNSPPRFVLSNSYHVALTFSLLGFPTYLFPLNPFYEQKHRIIMGNRYVPFKRFINNVNYYFELQQGFLSELAGKRSEFLKKLESILKKTPIKRKFNNVYTYKGWKTKDVLRNELDPYLSYTLKEINSVKKTNKDIIYQVNQKNKVLQENEKLLVEKAKIIDNLNGKIEKLEAAISNYKREIDEKSRAIQQLKEIKKEKDKLLQEKEKLLIDKDGKIEKLEAAISNYKREIDEKSRAIQQLNDELYRIKNSDGYKLLTQYYRLRDFTLPSGSLRRRALKGLFNLSKGTFPKQVSKTPNEAPENKVIEKENSKITENNLEDKEKYLYVCTHNVEGEKAMDIPVIKRNPNGILKGKRILIVTPDIVGPIRSGGIGTAFYELSKALTEAGAKVTILYTLGDYSEKETIQHWMNFYKSFGVEFIPLSPGKWLYEGTPYFRQVSHRVDEWLENHEKEFDVVISPEWMGNLYYALLAKKQGLRYSSIKFITNTHGPELWAYEGNYWFPPDLDFVDRDFLERNCVNLADYAVSPSNYLFEWMKERKWAYPKKAFVIQNIFDESILKKIKEGDYKEIKRLIFFGRPEPRKGLDLFSRALELLPDEVRSKIEEVIFVGKPIKTQNFDSIEYLDSYAEKLRIPFKLYTFQRDEALKFIKSKTDALIVIPSLVENSPYTVLEALNMKVPFIATNVGGIPELIKEEFRDSVLFDPVPSALSEKIAGSLGKKPILPKPAKTPDQTKNEWVDFIRGIVDKKEEIVKIKPVSPLVTVCLTHYNRPHLLKEAIDSLKAQTYKNFEVIIVDDGSSSTEAVNYLDSLKEDFQSRGWKIIRQKNRDVGAARNTAAKNARGEFLLFMDDDNIAKPNMLETFVKAYLNSQADAYTCINILFENGSSYKDSNKVWVPAGASLGSGMFINAFGDANALVKRNVFEKIGGFTEDYGIGCEDWEFFTKLVLSGFKLEVVPEPLYYYRVTENSKLRTMDVVKSEFGRSRPLMFMDSNGLGVGLAYGIKLFLDKLNQPKPDTNQSLPEDIKSSDYYEAKDLFLKYYNQKNWFKTAVKLSAKGLGFLDRLSKKK